MLRAYSEGGSWSIQCSEPYIHVSYVVAICVQFPRAENKVLPVDGSGASVTLHGNLKGPPKVQ